MSLNKQGEILVTGASGFVGKNLLSRLVKEGYTNISVFHRKGESKKVYERFGITTIYEGDFRQGFVELDEVFQKHHFMAVIHLAAVIKASSDEFLESNTLATERLVQLCQSQSQLAHFIFLSTDFILYDFQNNYRESKRLCEEAIRASTVPYTIFRPPPIYGPEDTKNFTTIFHLIDRFPIIPTPNYLMQPVFVGDVVSAILGALATDASVRKEYNLPGGSVMTFREMVKKMCEAKKKKRLLLPIPNALFGLGVKISEKCLKRPPLHYYQVAKWARNRIIPADDAVRDLGFTQTRFEDGIRHFTIQ